jgi:hypothetical protein
MRDPVKSLAACDSSFAAAVVEMSQRLPRSQLGCGCSCIKCSGNDGTPLPAAVVCRGNAQAADQSFSLLTWRILTLRTCVGAADNDFGSWRRHGRCRECRSWRTHGRNRTVAPAMLAHIEMRRLGKFGQCLAFRHASW